MPPLSDILLIATVILVVMAPMTASFLQCWADRARGGVKSMPTGRSCCDSCGKTLSAVDLVPIASWMWNRGKARCCQQPLSPALLWPEAAALFCAIWGAWVSPLPFAVVSVALVWALQAIILLNETRSDLTQGIVGVLTLIGLGMAVGGLTGPLWLHLGGLGLGLGAMAACRVIAPLRPYSDAGTVLAAAGALLGIFLLGIAVLAGVVLAVAFWSIAPNLGLPKPSRPHAALFGIATGLWLTWLYGLAV